MSFDLKNFSDFPLTRKDGSTTFMFANVVDDTDMQITHVFRGEDHLTNTVGQIVLAKTFSLARKNLLAKITFLGQKTFLAKKIFLAKEFS